MTAGFHTGFFPGGGGIDACKGYMRTPVHPLDFIEILDILKDKKFQIQLYYIQAIIMLLIVAVGTIMTS